MYPEDVEALFPTVPVGTKVRIINEPVKTAFVNGELLLEAHPPVDKEGQVYEPDLPMFSSLLDKALGPTTAAVHWDYALEQLQAARGMPVTVGIEAITNDSQQGGAIPYEPLAPAVETPQVDTGDSQVGAVN
jgi:L,D-transpeptidase ErfK/SrfK